MIDLDKNIEILINHKDNKRKRILALTEIYDFWLSYYLHKMEEHLYPLNSLFWQPLDIPMKKIVRAILLLLEDKDKEILGRVVTSIPTSCYCDIRISKKLIEALKEETTKHGSYEYSGVMNSSHRVRYTLKGLILRKIKEIFKHIVHRHIVYFHIAEDKKEKFILDLIKERSNIDIKRIRKILNFFEPNTICIPTKKVKKEKKIIERLAYNEPELGKNLEIITDTIGDYMKKKIESYEIKKRIKKYREDEETNIKERFGQRGCKICGKVFDKRKAAKTVHGKITGMNFRQLTDGPDYLNLASQWECLCNHIAESFYGKIFIQKQIVNGKKPDIIIDDGDVKFDGRGKITNAKKIIEIKLSSNFQIGLRRSILRYIDYCDLMEFWFCCNFEQEDLQDIFKEQLKDYKREIRWKFGMGSSVEFYRDEIKWIKKTRNIIGNKSIILKGWPELVKELKNKGAIKLIEQIKEIVKESRNSFLSANFHINKDPFGRERAIEERFNELLKHG